MDTLVIGPARGLADAVARGLRRQGRAVLQAIPADAVDHERALWLLDEAARPRQLIVFDDAPFQLVHTLMAVTRAEIVLVSEQRAAVARPNGVTRRSYLPREQPGLRVVTLGRAGRRWFQLGAGRSPTLSAERAAAAVLRSCDVARVA